MIKHKNAAQALRDARSYIEQGWCQGDFAHDGEGVFCGWNDPAARCWCVEGAILKAYEAEDGEEILSSMLKAKIVFARTVHTDDLPNWNDAEGRTRAEVLAAFDAAIALAEQGVQP